MQWLVQNWLWIAVAIGGFFLFTRSGAGGGMAGCGMGRSMGGGCGNSGDRRSAQTDAGPGNAVDPVGRRRCRPERRSPVCIGIMLTTSRIATTAMRSRATRRSTSREQRRQARRSDRKRHPAPGRIAGKDAADDSHPLMPAVKCDRSRPLSRVSRSNGAATIANRTGRQLPT